MRAVFFEETDARGLADRLRRAGLTSIVTAERLAGEDDDEDPQWVVTTDASKAKVGELAPDLDGWLESDEPPATAAPMSLPTAPKRIKRTPG